MSTDVLERAAAFLGTPYRLHGCTTEGWDCLGCLKVARRVLFDKPTPYGAAFYTREDAADDDRRAALFEVGALSWRPCTAMPGAAVLFNRFGRPAHVGLLLTRRLFLHARDEATGTMIEDLSGAWLRSVAGYFDAG